MSYGLPDASAAQRPEGVPADFVLEVSHGPCEGRCPVFTIRLDASGRLAWRGAADVGLVGAATRQVPASTVAAIVRRVDRARIMRLASPLPMCVDTPSVTVQLSLRGQHHTVRHESCWAEKTADGRRHDALIRGIEALLDVASWRDKWPAPGRPRRR